MKPANKPGRPGAESVEPRGGAKGTRASHARAGRRAGKACPRGWTVYGKQQGRGRRRQFTALLHHVDVELLRESFFWLQAEGGRREWMA